MSVSLERAAQCVGRSIKHLDGIDVSGTVHHVDKYDVWVDTGDEVLPCVPENMEWKSTIHPALRSAIEEWEDYESAQIGFSPFVWKQDDELVPFSNLGIVYSSAISNDDGNDRALFAIAPMIRRVYPLSITANTSTAFEIEELLGWAQP